MTTFTPAACSADRAWSETPRLTFASRKPLGPTAPVSPPPWPGSRRTVAPARGRPPARMARLPQGVCTTQPPGSVPSTGSTYPFGETTAGAAGSATAVVGGTTGATTGTVGGGTVSTVVGVRGADDARSSGSRVAAPDPHAVSARATAAATQ